jgi:hypothetical protein
VNPAVASHSLARFLNSSDGIISDLLEFSVIFYALSHAKANERRRQLVPGPDCGSNHLRFREDGRAAAVERYAAPLVAILSHPRENVALSHAGDVAMHRRHNHQRSFRLAFVDLASCLDPGLASCAPR